MGLNILDTFTGAGSSAKPNEDAVGHSSGFAWVIDGATGVEESPLIAPESTDAAWLAHTANRLFTEFAREPGSSLPGLIEQVIMGLASRFDEQKLRAPRARYELPSAGFMLVEDTRCGLRYASLGDCSLLVREQGKPANLIGKSRGAGEGQAAKRLGSNAVASTQLFSPKTMEHLRAARNLQNTPEGYWVLGLDPEAAKHATQDDLSLATATVGLLMTDGFAALHQDYARYGLDAFLDNALAKGLGVLAEELRHIERVEDPQGDLYPRFKQSDDASAILFRWLPEHENA